MKTMEKDFSENALLQKIDAEADAALASRFESIDRCSRVCTERIMKAFASHRVSESTFAPSTGYGYGDRGRDTLDEVWSEVFGTEAALVRHNIVNGTHALTIGLFGLLRPGDTLLSVTGKPYDTLDDVIGISGEPGCGSLRDFGVNYKALELLPDGTIDFKGLDRELAEGNVKVVYLQRSKGYQQRPTLSADEIGGVTTHVHAVSDAFVFVDNCYGEFCDDHEPHADLLVGSLIKNPGGGMAESGGYLAGTKKAVDLCANRLTTPGIGAEAGATLGTTRNMFKGLFFAPHVTAQALKTACYAAYVFERLGCEVSPRHTDERHDIIQTITLGSAEGLVGFCGGIQSGSPVDAFVTPEAWEMPGYSDPVVMAAGGFVSGSSIELSADGPVRPPYVAFIQGGLTFESGRYGMLRAAERLLETR